MSEEAKNIKLSCLAITVLTFIFFTSNETGISSRVLDNHFRANKERLPWCALTLNSVLLKHPKCTDDGPMDASETDLKITAALYELSKAHLIIDGILKYSPAPDFTYQDLVDIIKKGVETCPKFRDYVEREFTFLGKKDRDYILQQNRTSIVEEVPDQTDSVPHGDERNLSNAATSNTAPITPETKLMRPKDQVSLFQRCIEKHMKENIQ